MKNLRLKESLLDAAGVTAGAIGAGFITKAVKGAMGVQADKFAPFIPLALGLALPMFVKKNAMVKNMGLGMIAVGGIMLYNKVAPAGVIQVAIQGVNDSISAIDYPQYNPGLRGVEVTDLIHGNADEEHSHVSAVNDSVY